MAGRAQEVEVKVVTHRTTAQQAALAGVERELDSLVQSCGEADCSSAAAQAHHSYQYYDHDSINPYAMNEDA